MTINKNYDSSEDEEWDMVPDGHENELSPTTTENERTPTPPTQTEMAVETEDETKVLPSAPSEDEVMNLTLAEQEQSKLGITDETSPEEIQALMDSVTTTTKKKEESEDTPLLSTTTTPPAENGATNEPPKPTQLPGWLQASLGAATKVIQDVEQKHDLKHKTRQSLHKVGSSLRQVGSTLQTESQGLRHVVKTESRRLSQTVQQKAEDLDLPGKAQSVAQGVQHQVQALDVPGKAQAVTQTLHESAQKVHAGAQTAGATLRQGAQTAAQEWNQEGKVTHLAAAAAVVGTGLLLASKGKPGAGAAVMATGGAALWATEAGSRRYDPGLNEDLHLE